jgi:hypothetical protein
LNDKKAEKAAKRVRASGLPKIEQLPGRLNFDATISLADFQATHLARLFGLTPQRAAVAASLAFCEVRP